MKKLKYLFTAIITALSVVALSSCMIINAQKLDDVKGTYRLSSYTYTPEYERKEGYTPKTTDYIVDKGYVEYLVVTGASTGYFIHKDNEMPAYVTEVQLSYEYDEEKTSHVRTISYKKPTDSEGQSLGVQKNKLNYSKPSINYTQLFTKKQMATSSWSVSWEKVDKATDLSYVQTQLSELKEYDSVSFPLHGIYELGYYPDLGYEYYYVGLDTSKNGMKAYVYYKKTGEDPVVRQTYDLTKADDWNSFTFNGETWQRDADMFTAIYFERTVQVDDADLEIKINHTGMRNVESAVMEEYIAERNPSILPEQNPEQTPEQE